jgi:ABC-type transport system involved in cytochrome c biogenesis permease subunit
VTWLGLLIHTAGIILRVVLGGRPPVSNFFETMLWIPLIAVVLGLILERTFRLYYAGLSAALLAWLILLIADHVPLDPSISPVVAVLRSNLWLTIHVLTIVGSYGILALATVLAHCYGWVWLMGKGVRRRLPPLERLTYRTIQIGVVCLASGIMLGAVWANASWGRYWGWDPKETWALITLLWFLAVLHGRFAGWVRGIGVALAAMGGILPLLMTYYGVSFYLAGLHSYAGGRATAPPVFLVGYVLGELAFMAFVGWRALSQNRMA